MGIRQVFERLKWYDMAVVVIGLAVVILLQVQSEVETPADEVEFALFSSSAQVEDLREFPTQNEEALKEFAEWRATPEYFGAFAVDAEGAYGWSTRYNSLDAARTGAGVLCGKWSEACVLVAVTVPADYAPTKAVTMSAGAMDAFHTYQDRPGPKAVALSEIGFLQWVSGQPSRKLAEDQALSDCEAKVTAYIEDGPLPHWPCQILRSEGP